MVWGWDFLYSPSSFLSVIHNTSNRPRPASTACVLPYDKKRANQHTNYCLRHLKTWYVKRILRLKLKFEEAAIKATTKMFDVGIECCFFPFLPSPLEKDSGSWSTPNIH